MTFLLLASRPTAITMSPITPPPLETLELTQPIISPPPDSPLTRAAPLPRRCAFICGPNGQLEKFTPSMQERLVRDVIEPMACDGLRTIGVAYRDFVPGKAEINQVRDAGGGW